MIQKNFDFFFAFFESTYFNSQKKAIKFFSADFPLYDGLRLRKFFEIFRKKCFLKTIFLANHFKYIDETWSKVRQNEYKADGKD